MKIKLLLSFLCLGVFFNDAQSQTTYFTGFDTESQRQGWTQFRVGTEVNPFYEWEISPFDAHSDSNCLMHLYPVAGLGTTDDWYVSPAFNFSAGAVIDSIWTRFSGFGVPMNDDTVALYLLTGHQHPDSADRQLLRLFTDSTYNNDNVWRKAESVVIEPKNGESYLGFRYFTSTSNWLDVHFDDLGLTIETPLGLNETQATAFQVYPNPAQTQVFLKSENGISNHLQVVTLSGKVIQQTIWSQSFELNTTEWSEGVYLLKNSSSQGTEVTKLLVIH